MEVIWIEMSALTRREVMRSLIAIFFHPLEQYQHEYSTKSP